MGHCERHEPCQCKERETKKIKGGHVIICKSCGHTFKEVIYPKTMTQGFLN